MVMRSSGYIDRMRPYPYPLVGGHPVLDFLNTIEDRNAAERVERLTSFTDVLRFAAAAGVVEPSELRHLAGSTAEVRRLRELRERLARIFTGIVHASAVSVQDLDRLTEDAAAASSAWRVRRAHGGFVRQIRADRAGARVVLWRLASAAMTLLTSDDATLVNACPRCGWFFLDVSKNRSRRWCSMRMCGASAKARAYYYRHRGEGRSALTRAVPRALPRRTSALRADRLARRDRSLRSP
jgi:predicted RNA-binding Zn ribbon-like protein